MSRPVPLVCLPQDGVATPSWVSRVQERLSFGLSRFFVPARPPVLVFSFGGRICVEVVNGSSFTLLPE